MHRYPGNISGIHYLAYDISRIFSEHGFDKVHIRRCCSVAAIIIIFRVKIVSPNSLKPIAGSRNNLVIVIVNNSNTIPVNKFCLQYSLHYFLKQRSVTYYKYFIWLFISDCAAKSFKRNHRNQKLESFINLKKIFNWKEI